MLKALLLDLDGTLTTKDMLDVACDLLGQTEENERIKNQPSSGLDSLIERINLIQGQEVGWLQSVLFKDDALRSGAIELIQFAQEKGLRTIVCSGNILPILQYYQQKLELDFVLGSPVRLNDGKIEGISLEDYAFPEGYKLNSVEYLLSQIGLDWSEVAAVGDSLYDTCWFEKTKLSIAVGDNSEVRRASDFQVDNNLQEIIPILQEYL
jgi:HAD superfamily phosphoserine phosphatase-like hydrolase